MYSFIGRYRFVRRVYIFFFSVLPTLSVCLFTDSPQFVEQKSWYNTINLISRLKPQCLYRRSVE